jgi:hypothetical protein
MLTIEQNEILEKRYPDATNFILRCELTNEYRDLIKEGNLLHSLNQPLHADDEKRLTWIENRLMELGLMSHLLTIK